MTDTYQTFGTGINDQDQEEADGKPSLRVFGGEVAKRDDACFLDEEHASNANRGLDAEE